MIRPAGQPDLFRRKSRRPPPPSEVGTHIAVADVLRRFAEPQWFWSHIGHGGHRTAATGRLLKRMGLKPGLFDFLLINPQGSHQWLEMKAGSRPLTPEQKAFAQLLTERGVEHAVARSFTEAIETLQRWGAISNRVRPQ